MEMIVLCFPTPPHTPSFGECTPLSSSHQWYSRTNPTRVSTYVSHNDTDMMFGRSNDEMLDPISISGMA